jgi:hypothetical protein
MTPKRAVPKYKVGDRIRFKFGLHTPLAEIVEYRGLLAYDRQPLYRVKFEFDPPNILFTEVPEDEILSLE